MVPCYVNRTGGKQTRRERGRNVTLTLSRRETEPSNKGRRKQTHNNNRKFSGILWFTSHRSSAAQTLLVSGLFLQSRGGGSRFNGRDGFQNTLSAWQTRQSRPLMAHRVFESALPETRRSSPRFQPVGGVVVGGVGMNPVNVDAQTEPSFLTSEVPTPVLCF